MRHIKSPNLRLLKNLSIFKNELVVASWFFATTFSQFSSSQSKFIWARTRDYGAGHLGAGGWVPAFGSQRLGAGVWVPSFGCRRLGAGVWVPAFGCRNVWVPKRLGAVTFGCQI